MNGFAPFFEQDWKRIGHQKTIPFHKPKPLYRQPTGNDEFGNPYDAGGYDTTGLYHVTPYLNRILASRQLKSQTQLQGERDAASQEEEDRLRNSPEFPQMTNDGRADTLADIRSRRYDSIPIGLGSGSHPESAQYVSLTYSYQRAVEIYEQMKFAVAIAHGQVKASQIWSNFDDPYPFYGEDGEMSQMDRVVAQYVPKRIVLSGDGAAISAALDKKLTKPADLFRFFTALEVAVTETESEDEDSGRESYRVNTSIGFTGDFNTMSKIDPKQVGILQVLMRKGAPLKHVPEEAEVRARPQDLVIMRYTQP